MNQYGEKYIKEVNDLCKGRTLPEITESAIQERIMRMGQEVRQFDLDVTNYKEMERVAIATIREDWLVKND